MVLQLITSQAQTVVVKAFHGLLKPNVALFGSKRWMNHAHSKATRLTGGIMYVQDNTGRGPVHVTLQGMCRRWKVTVPGRKTQWTWEDCNG